MRSDPFTGRYLFHLHTACTDGTMSVRDYFESARRLGVERLIFLEHIRSRPGYDVGRLVVEVRETAALFGLPAFIGFEAKVLPGGGLDISPEHAALADVLGVAEHGFPGEYDDWRAALTTALQRSAVRYADKPLVWVHPGLWLKKQGLLAAHEQAYLELLDQARALGVKLERNLRYGLVPEALLGELPPADLVLGADAHRPADLAAAVALLR